eukprot:g4335.t1
MSWWTSSWGGSGGGGGSSWGSNRAKDDTNKYKDGYPKEDLDDLTKDWNWAFFSNQMKSQGHGGLKVEDVIKKWWGDYDGLESKHDYIQWLFPIHESSAFNYQSQALQRHEVRKIRRSPVATANFLRCYDLILDFFGFVVANKATGELKLKAHDADGRLRNLNTHSHNYLRITRILKCLGEMGFEHYKVPFLKAMATEIYVTKKLDNAEDGFERYWKNTLANPGDQHEIDRFAAPLIALAKREAEKRRKNRSYSFDDECEYKEGERVKAKYEGKWYEGSFSKYKYWKRTPYAVQCDADKKGTLTWVSKDDIESIEPKPDPNEAEKKKEDEEKEEEEEPLKIDIPDKPWPDEAERVRFSTAVALILNCEMPDKAVTGMMWKTVFRDYLPMWFLKSKCWIHFCDVTFEGAKSPSLRWDENGNAVGAFEAGKSFDLRMKIPGVDNEYGFVGLYRNGQLDEVISERVVPVPEKKSEVTLSFKKKQGPWDDTATYEFRYFAAGWNPRKSKLRFVPSRGPDATSGPFKINAPASMDSSGVFPKPVPRKEPDESELASKNLNKRRSRWSNDYDYDYKDPWEDKKKRLKKLQKEYGLVPKKTRLQVKYLDKWYDGTYTKWSVFKGKSPWGIQCDADKQGVLTYASIDVLRTMEEKPLEKITTVADEEEEAGGTVDDVMATPEEGTAPVNNTQGGEVHTPSDDYDPATSGLL